MAVPADQPVGRIRFMDQQRVNLDGFAVEAWSRCARRPTRSRGWSSPAAG
jgi:hypothetical protein